jgi:cell division protein FtsB
LKAEAQQLKSDNRSLKAKINRLEKTNVQVTEALAETAKQPITITTGTCTV